MKEFKTTEEITVPKRLIDQILGQDKAVEIIKKAAAQRRNALLIGPPGTGKSMLAQAMAELMPTEKLEDILVYSNPNNENQPLVSNVKTYPDYDYLKKQPTYIKYFSQKELATIKKLTEENEAHKILDIIKFGLGRRIVNYKKPEEREAKISPFLIFGVLGIILLGVVFFADVEEKTKWLVLALVLGVGFLYILYNASSGLSRRLNPIEHVNSKLIVDNSGRKTAPFIDATGTRAGALLGDIKHDPLQTGGLGTPAHLRVESGAIHRANKGVLFIDEIASLKMNWQQEILTAMQEKKYSITGQSEMSSGALVKTEQVPTDFVLVAAGNLSDLTQIHPALRSRIMGAGYEIYVEDSMDDNDENENKLVQFVAQEVFKDSKIPHFTKSAVMEIIEEARRCGRRKRFTLNLRQIGGLIRAAGDIAKGRSSKYTEKEDVINARKVFRSIESQLSRKIIEQKKEYQTIMISGNAIGRVNGLAVLGDANSGLVLPLVAEITPASSKSEGKVIATGKLGTIAKEAVENVSAVVKKHIGVDISKHDIHIQFLQTYEGVEGDSASISIAVAVISAMMNIPVKQDHSITGSLDVRGGVLPVGGVTAKIEAAIDTGLREVIIPDSNSQDVYLPENRRNKIKIIAVKNLLEVLEHALKDSSEKRKLLAKMKKQFRNSSRK